MSKRVRFLMLGGFLGSGKTTAIGRLAEIFQAQGKNVGIVTNDQAAGLVDTHWLRSRGFQVDEVAGACFCCNFNELTETMQRLSAKAQPDVVIAEPVGSCTDLVATVAQPIMRRWGRDIEVGPHAVILKPSHGRRILERRANAGFSPKAEYIFRKQLEEADLLLLNRVDELSAQEADRLEELLVEGFPGRPVVRVSATRGDGFDRLARLLLESEGNCRRILDLDYDVYAEGEAELGWLNSNVVFRSDEPFSLDQLLVEVVERLRSRLLEANAEPAHLKTIGLFEDRHAVVNLISSDTPVTLSLASNIETTIVEMVVNARVVIDPNQLRQLVTSALQLAAANRRATLEIRTMEAFRPGRPVPTFRVSKSDAI